MAWKRPKAANKIVKRHRQAILAPGAVPLLRSAIYPEVKENPGHTWSTPVSTEKVV